MPTDVSLRLRDMLSKVEHRLKEGTNSIGRNQDSDIFLDDCDNKVSRDHAVIRVDSAGAQIRDRDSRNKTIVNGEALTAGAWYPLGAGDHIEICKFNFKVVTDDVESDDRSSCRLIDSGVSNAPLFSLSISDLASDGGSEKQQLQALVQLSQCLRNVLKSDDVMQRSVAVLLHIFTGAERVVIALKEIESIKPKWWRNRFDQDTSDISISRTLVQDVLESSSAIISNDAQGEFDSVESVHLQQVRSVMCAPLVNASGEPFGVVYLDSVAGGQFKSLDLEVLAAVSTQLSLALDFVKLHEVAMQNALFRQDVEKASEIQAQYLPTSPPQIHGFDVAGYYHPARHVGGDYYDYIPLPDGRWAIAIGDVIGKGVPAALTMVRVATETRASFESLQSASGVLARLNEKLAGSFVTMLIAVIDPESSSVSIGNAGHELPVRVRKDGTVDLLKGHSPSLPIGVLEGEEYSELTVDLQDGESITIYSDGFTDAEASDGKRFGKERLYSTIKSCSSTSAESVQLIVSEAEQYIGTHPQFDDMCLVQIRRA